MDLPKLENAVAELIQTEDTSPATLSLFYRMLSMDEFNEAEFKQALYSTEGIHGLELAYIYAMIMEHRRLW